MPLKPVSLGCGLPARACLPDAPGGLSLGQTLHLDTNKWSEGSWCLSLNWKLYWFYQGLEGEGSHPKSASKGRSGKMPSCLFSPANMTEVTWGNFTLKAGLSYRLQPVVRPTWMTPGRKKRSNRGLQPHALVLWHQQFCWLPAEDRAGFLGFFISTVPKPMGQVALSEPKCSKRPAISIAPARMKFCLLWCRSCCDKQHPLWLWQPSANLILTLGTAWVLGHYWSAGSFQRRLGHPLRPQKPLQRGGRPLCVLLKGTSQKDTQGFSRHSVGRQAVTSLDGRRSWEMMSLARLGPHPTSPHF